MITTKTTKGIAGRIGLLALGAQLGILAAAGTLGFSGDARGAAPTRVTGLDPASAAATQSETACTVGVYPDHRIETVVYNDETGEQEAGFLTYTPTTRTIRPGYAGIAWSWRSRTAADPNPAWTAGKLRPPTNLGFDLIWSDPAVTSDPAAPDVVFYGALAVPHAKVPSSGTIEGGVAGDCTPLGGACVARSTNGGMTFGYVDCFSDLRDVSSQTCTGTTAVTNGHFYDGASLAITRSATPGGPSSAYFAAVDVSIAREAIWKMADVGSSAAHPFQRETTRLGNLRELYDPANFDLPGELDVVATHLRLRSSGGSLWKMAFNASQLKVNIHDRNGPAVPIADNVTTGYPVAFANGAVRTGPDYAFDIGLDQNGQPEMRFVYIAVGNSTTWVQGGRCTMDLTCERPALWRSPPVIGDSYFHPNIKFGRDPTTGKGYWKVSYYGRTSNEQVAIFAGDLVAPDVALAPAQVTPAQTPCPDKRGTLAGTTVGYWGDYDDMSYDSCSNTFARFFTDSSPQCIAQSAFTSDPVHVSAVELAADPLQTVTLTGNVHIVDQENLGENEIDDWPFSESCAVNADHPVDNHLATDPGFWHRCTGDEAVVNVFVTCTLQPDGGVQVAMHSELREATGCDPQEELEDQEDTTQVVAFGATIPFNVDLTHDCFNCGDHAEIRINAANAVRPATCSPP